LTNDSVAQFTGHADPVFNVNVRPVAPYDTFVSGDSSDKAYIWKIQAKTEEIVEQKVEEKKAEIEAGPQV